MSNKKGGLGMVNTDNKDVSGDDVDLLDSVFGETTPKNKGEDTPPLNPLNTGKKPERIAKHFMIDRQLAKEIKLYAVEHDMKELEVIDLALRSFLDSKEAE